jgi:acetyl-CoA C-acetyltransferase
MPPSAVLIPAWARSAVAPRDGAFKELQAHDIAAPVVKALLQRGSVRPDEVDAVVVGNALGAGGNPARMVALAAGLPDRCPALSVDTQCCSGLDAVSVAVGLIASRQASVVIAGGVEAWSRAPIRQHRPMREGESPTPYERPAFCPDPARDPDMLLAAASYALAHGVTRQAQEAYALRSHQQALQHRAAIADEIVAIAGLAFDAYPRELSAQRAARMPVLGRPSPSDAQWTPFESRAADGIDCSMSTLSVSSKADGAAFVLLASSEACQRLGLSPRMAWSGSVSVGSAPETPLLAAEAAATALMRKHGPTNELAAIELHDAFAVQGLSFCEAMKIDPARVNRRGGGLARGHPIGASAAIALVRLLADLSRDATSGARGLTAIAGAGGVGAAALVSRL